MKHPLHVCHRCANGAFVRDVASSDLDFSRQQACLGLRSREDADGMPLVPERAHETGTDGAGRTSHETQARSRRGHHVVARLSVTTSRCTA